MTIRNPWGDLPHEKPYVLPCDEPFVRIFNHGRRPQDATWIHTELLPEPYFGPHRSPVVVLLLNPAFKGDERRRHRDPAFTSRLRSAITNPSGAFFHLDDGIDGPGHEWWSRKTRALVRRTSQDCVKRSILAVEFFPYHSEKFAHALIRLPSQSFSFSLVEQAMERSAEIVLVRGRTLWFGAVPGLATYRRLHKLRSINAALSPRNLVTSTAFERIVQALSRGPR
jgi:hypothetical protein